MIGKEPSIFRGMVTWYTPSPAACGTSLNDEGVSLSQTLGGAQAGEQISLEAIVRALLPTTGSFPVTIDRGHIGATTVRLYRLDTSVATSLGEVTWGGIKKNQPENTEAYAKPVRPAAESTADLPYNQAELEGMVEQWRQVIFEFAPDWEALY